MRVLLCPMSDAGYLYPALAVGRQLAAAGHQVEVLGRSAAAAAVAAAGLPFIAADPADADGFVVATWHHHAALQYRSVLHTARDVRPDVLLTSVLSHGALLAAETADLPAAVLGFASHLWSYRSGGDGEDQQQSGRSWRAHETVRHHLKVRAQLGLRPRRESWPERQLYGAGLLLRGHPALEFPGAQLPSEVRQVGPCRWEPAADQSEVEQVLQRARRSGKRLVYVQLGRTFGGESMWPLLNASFTGGDWQAIVELGRSGPARVADGADIVAVRKPWLSPLLQHCEVVLNNGTSSPTLAALEHRKPLLLAPMGSEQPLLTAACVRAGIARRFELGDALTAVAGRTARTGLADALAGVVTDRKLAGRVRQLGDELQAMDGSTAAASFVTALATSALSTERTG